MSLERDVTDEQLTRQHIADTLEEFVRAPLREVPRIGLPNPPVKVLREVGQMEDHQVASLAYAAGWQLSMWSSLSPRHAAAVRVAYARAGGTTDTVYDDALWRWVMDHYPAEEGKSDGS